MNGTIERVMNRLIQPLEAPDVIRLFTALVYGWFVVNAAMCWPVHELLWGPDAVLLRYGAPATIVQNQIYGLLYFPSRFPWIFFPHVVAAVWGMFDTRWSFIPRVVTWITGLMLYYAAIPAFNSGMLIMLLLAFYCIPVHTRTTSTFRHVLNRFSRSASLLQIILCYAFSAIFKLSGAQWIGGDAVYYALHIERFSQPWITGSGWLAGNMIPVILSYFALFYQVLFPIVVFLHSAHRRWILLIGVLMHLFIGAVMNLWDFALAMIFVYALFLDQKTANRLLSFTPRNYFRGRFSKSF